MKERCGWPVGLWVTESRDDGVSWSPPEPTDFTDNGTKFHFARLPDGRFYYVGCPDPEPRGEGGQYGYPHTLVQDSCLYVIVSRMKEPVQVIRVGIDRLG